MTLRCPCGRVTQEDLDRLYVDLSGVVDGGPR